MTGVLARGPDGPEPYTDPYRAGIALGLVLLAAFVLAGRGLGASGAFGATSAGLVASVAPDTVAANPYLDRYLQGGTNPLGDWIVLEILGVIVGGWLSARWSRRFAVVTERGPRVSPGTRLAFAGAGGTAMGAGAVLARGCTSGLALSGGALLSVGSWIFIATAFGAAYLAAPAARRLWR